MCALFSLRFHGYDAVHLETSATRLYLKIGSGFQLARRHVCVFVIFKLGVSVIVE